MAAALLTQTALNLVRPVTTYKLLDLGADAAVVGITTAAYAVLPLVTVMWLGRRADRAADLRIMAAGGAMILALGAGGLALSPTIALVAAASAVLGLGHLVFTIAGQTSIARFASEEDLDQGFGWFTAAYSAGQLAGPLIAGIMLNPWQLPTAVEALTGVSASLWAGSELSLLAIPLLLWRRADSAPSRGRARGRGHKKADPRTAVAPREDPAQPASLWRILKVPGVPSHMLASLALLSTMDILVAFLPLIGEEAGVAPVWVGALLAIRGAASILSRIILPWLSERFSRGTLVLVSLFGSALTMTALPMLLTAPWWATVALLIGGFCLGLGQPLTMTLVSTAVPTPWRGSALAVRLMGNRAGQVAMPLAAGVVAAPLGPAGAIWFSCGVLLISGLQKALSR